MYVMYGVPAAGASYDPWRASITALCDPWSEWRGMEAAVQAQHAELELSYSRYLPE